eukprot:gnl/TRDRNA2_/TRDRNA2_54938_c0_seq1.p1 gnl/TRDRNA2_/TRDRNA2_54938_c0~~gnl/TRDRNA2_/TRDRNA2_54938_c0_seq1.p1  ORF type:complete len:998 (+),score=249.98 gnl/TRDRNA2_/TRDRNA2_54938_c0_seq1:81-3074(+)
MLEVRQELERELVQGFPAAAKMDECHMMPSFGFPGSLEKNAPYARFDIREEVCMRVGGFKHGTVVRDADGREFVVVGVKRVEGTPRLWFQPKDLGRPGAGAFPGLSAAELQAKFSKVKMPTGIGYKKERLQEVSFKDFDAAEDSDGEETLVCNHCQLPLGTCMYSSNGKHRHGECEAQHILAKVKEDEEARQQKDAALKKARHAEHGVGWHKLLIPRNDNAAMKLEGASPSQGMCCVVLEENCQSIRLAETTEPAAAVNLEYLSTALRVRLLEGREPLFSLDPLDPKCASNDPKASMQVKRFEPDWLAGTSVGDVLFQADYHLKELSMGEYEQPVAGMKSCFDFMTEEGSSASWKGREWFVVNHAEVRISDDNVLMPHVKMGVEAREQILGAEGILEDAVITRADHPLVKYAEEFTKNFDLIAERKSVIYHLRELAKASILAKFLIENEIPLEETWFNLAEEADATCCLEIPQLWNDRRYSQINVRDGKIVDAAKGIWTRGHSVYGGVDFGLDKYPLASPIVARGTGFVAKFSNIAKSTRTQVQAEEPGALSPATYANITNQCLHGGGQAPGPGVFGSLFLAAASRVQQARVLGKLPSALREAPRQEQARGLIAAQRAMVPQGVDLNLDEFDVSVPVPVEENGPKGSWKDDLENLEGEQLTIGNSFWKSLDGKAGPSLKEEDQHLLRAIFNSNICDRREEGDMFSPPVASFSYVQNLRDLVKQEDLVRQQRIENFLREDFVMSRPGPLFPSSWTSSIEIAQAQAASLQARPDYKSEAAAFEHILTTTAPLFDKCTEDGLRFRIYKCGSLEVRTTQAYESKETIGMVFSMRSSTHTSTEGAPKDHDKVVKVTEYVERARAESSHRSYVVIETKEGHIIVTEKFMDGTVTWEENPKDLQDRNSLAKVVRSAGYNVKAGVTVGDMRKFQAKESVRTASGVSHSQCKHYAQVAFTVACGTQHADSGFRQQTTSWQLSKAAGAEPPAKVGNNFKDMFSERKK